MGVCAAMLFAACYLLGRLKFSPVSSVSGKSKQEQGYQKIQQRNLLWIIMVAAFFFHIIGSIVYKGYEADINCFLYWSSAVYKDGITSFYQGDFFHDYPPGYMYILYIIGFLRSVLSLDSSSMASVVLIKLPAIFCDLGAGYLIYHVAAKKWKGNLPLVAAALYLFNPAIWINSAIWGQVDAVFTLCVALVCYFIEEKKLPYAYFVLAVGILIKPQTMFIGPVLILGIIDQVFLKNFTWKRMLKELGLGLMAIGLMFVLAMPFGLPAVLAQYTDTVTSYPYASVNAYNLFTLAGKNWADQGQMFFLLSLKNWGMLFIALVIAGAAWINFKCKEMEGKYYFLGALIITGIFTLSVRMHERYLFPAILLLVLAFVQQPRKEVYLLFSGLSCQLFCNTAHVLFYYQPEHFDAKADFPRLVALIGTVLFGYMIYVAKKFYSGENKETITGEKNLRTGRRPLVKRDKPEKKKEFRLKRSRKLPVMEKRDWIIVAVISAIYAVIAFYGLGDRKAPESGLIMEYVGDTFTVDLGSEIQLSQIGYYNGYQNNPKYSLEIAGEDGIWYTIYSDSTLFDFGSVFHWNRQDFYYSARYLRFTNYSGRNQLMELAFFDEDGEVVKAVDNPETRVLFDEQELIPERTTDENSTYFDEIYHARTAYEMIHHLYCYENTHPPLGKLIISVGIRIFGMCPFGWRFMGTLFGVLMLPVIYAFIKKLLGPAWICTVGTLLFAFDFMHFAQTRIATIDVFITFFILVMYYFMYQYTQMSFYDTELKKTFVPLAFSGIFMGIGCATKWTGVYAGIGLAVIFFATILRRYREYLHALKMPKGSSEGIRNQKIIQSFFPNLWKTGAFCVLFFVVIPCVIYTLAYIPFVDGSDDGVVTRMFNNIQTMYNYHSKLEGEHSFSSFWYQWPTMYRPIWFYSGSVSDTVKEGISSFGNPLVWWAGIPAFLYLLWDALLERNQKAGFLCVSYLAQYVPWFFVSRMTFIYHYFPSVPFVTLMLSYCFYLFGDGDEKKKMVIFGYTAAAVMLFVLFYPVLAGQAVNVDYVDKWLRWFDSWVLTSS